MRQILSLLASRFRHSLNSAQRRARLLMVVLALVLHGVLGVGSAVAQHYLLQSGDRLLLSFPGLTTQTWESTIDLSGEVSFPFLGAQQAAGLSLSDLHKQMEINAIGLEVQVFDNGSKSSVVLSGEEIYLQVAQYRPVTVTGDVVNPGSIVFTPGLTVRALLGQAGGIQPSSLSNSTVPMDYALRLQTALQTQKWLRAQVLGGQILLDAPIESASVSPDQSEAIQQLLAGPDGTALVSELEITLRERQNARADLQNRITLTSNRVSSLRQAYANYERASASEEDRLQRMLEMSDRGLVTENRVSEARNYALATSSRLLTVNSDIYEAKAELERLEQELSRLDDGYHSDILAEQRRFAQQLAEVDAQVDSLRYLMLSDGSIGENATATTQILVHRGVADHETSVPIKPGALVQPGDVIEVRIKLQHYN